MTRQKALCRTVRTVDWVLNTLFLALVVLVVLFCLYVALENYRMVASASSSRYQAYKPVADDTVSFEQLQSQNPDVFAWLVIDDTKIDYPVVQGESNDTYVNTDVFGNYSLTGALFLDFRNARDFSDPVSIIYGHNMAGDAMLGGIDLFEDRDYFDSHRTGTLMYGGEYYRLEIFAFLEASGYDAEIYDPGVRPAEYAQWLQRVLRVSANVGESIPNQGPVVVLSTCAVGATDGRKLLAASIHPGGTPPTQREESGWFSAFVLDLFSFDMERRGMLPWFWFSILLLMILTALHLRYRHNKRKAAQNHG